PRTRRVPAVSVGFQRLPDHRDHYRADLGPTRRSLRPPPGAADRHHDLRDRLHAVCRSPGMAALIVFRTLQGVGAGCIQPVVFTLVGDIFPLPQRARLQGFFSSMWAVAAVIGPALGAVFVSTIGWRWIFLINLPIGLVAGTLIFRHRERRPEAVVDAGIDVRSAILLTAGIGLLLWGLGTGSQTAAPVWWAIGAGAAMLAAFGLVEMRSRRPLLPLDLLRSPVIGPAVMVG